MPQRRNGAVFGLTPREARRATPHRGGGLIQFTRPGGRRAEPKGAAGSRAVARRTEPAWTAARRDEAAVRAECPCHAGKRSRLPLRAGRAKTGLAATAGNGTPQPPLWRAARSASKGYNAA